MQRTLRTEEVVGAHLESVSVRQVDVLFVTLVDTITALRCLQIDIGRLRILSHRLPEHLSLIVRQVDAMHMVAGILTLQEGIIVGIIQTGIDYDCLFPTLQLGCPYFLSLTFPMFLHHPVRALVVACLRYSRALCRYLADAHQGYQQSQQYIESFHQFSLFEAQSYK